MADLALELQAALHAGDPRTVAALIAAGADVRRRRKGGYDALIDAVHGRDLRRDPRLLDLLALLVASGAPLDGVSEHSESALRVLSRIGRFDAVRFLLEVGADRSHLAWTPLIEAVALGTLAEVERLALEGAPLEETDWWERTAWLVSLLAGELPKAQLLRDLGANTDARGRCGQPPLFYAVQGRHPDVLRWLLDVGQDVEQFDQFAATPLMEAVEAGDLGCVDVLIAAGADVDADAPSGSVLSLAATRDVAKRLLAAGADPRRLSQAGQRALCGLGEVRDSLAGVSPEDFRRAYTRRFGAGNPERIQEPFWEAMIRSGMTAYAARERFVPGAWRKWCPVWCAARFGQSATLLPDGRVVQIGGEHEDHYDPDFCIYNDVFVHADGAVTVYAYPEEVFPPTDFHTATVVDGAIYVIGSLGYAGARRYGHTPVHRLDLETFRMEGLETTGDAPGWIYDHRAFPAGPGAIRVTGGTVVTPGRAHEIHAASPDAFVLDLATRTWRRERGAEGQDAK